MESMLAVGLRHTIREKKPGGHRKGQGNRATQQTLNGYTTAEVIRLGRKPLHRLTPKEKQALEMYWESRLALMDLGVERGRMSWLTFQADIGVRDAYNRDRAFFIPVLGDGLDSEE